MPTSEEIRNQEFLVTLRGYDREEVSTFLDEVAREHDQLRSRVSELERQVNQLEAAGGEGSRTDMFKALGEETTRILVSAEEAAEQMRDEAERDASQHLEQTRDQARDELEQARQTAADELTQARETAADELEQARRSAQQTVDDANRHRESVAEAVDRVADSINDLISVRARLDVGLKGAAESAQAAADGLRGSVAEVSTPPSEQPAETEGAVATEQPSGPAEQAPAEEPAVSPEEPEEPSEPEESAEARPADEESAPTATAWTATSPAPESPADQPPVDESEPDMSTVEGRSAPETSAPETSAPETSAPETSAPPERVEGPSAPDTTDREQAAREDGEPGDGESGDGGVEAAARKRKRDKVVVEDRDAASETTVAGPEEVASEEQAVEEPEPSAGEPEAVPEPEPTPEPQATPEPEEPEPEPEAGGDDSTAVADAAAVEAAATQVQTRRDEEAPSEEEAFDLREETMSDLRRGMLRRLKRSLHEIENAVLDDLGQAASGASDDLDAASLLPAEGALQSLDEVGRVFIGASYEAGLDAGTELASLPGRGEDQLGDTGRADEAVNAFRQTIEREMRASLEATLRAGIEAGETGDSLSERADQVFADLKGPIAQAAVEASLARTYELGVRDRWREAGLAGRTWVVGEETRCPENRCAGNAEEGAVALGENFPSGDAVPPAHPGCTCTTLPA